MTRAPEKDMPMGCAVAVIAGFIVATIVSIAVIIGLVYVLTDALCVAFDESDKSVACQSIR